MHLVRRLIDADASDTRFEVGAGRYGWLRESLFVGRGRLAGRRAITYELYRVL